MVSSTNLVETPVEDIPSFVQAVNATFKAPKTQTIEWRKEQLRQLWRLLDEHNDDLFKLSTKIPASSQWKAESSTSHP